MASISKTVSVIGAVGTVAAILLPSAAFAHPGHGATLDAAHGFAHPLSGIDHILAMVSVGLIAAQRGGRALWVVPLTFMGMMAAAGAAAAGGLALPHVEAGIALSVIVLGAIVAADIRLPTVLTTAIVAVFAIFHGHAHGAEMPETASGLGYGLGFVMATGLLHGTGIALGTGLARLRAARPLVRALGAAIGISGVAVLAGVL